MDYTYEQNKTIERAIIFLVESVNKSGINPKPVILHSIRSAMLLYSYEYPVGIVVGALLHDVIEDSNVSRSDIQNTFGKEIADLADSVSFDKSIQDRTRQFYNQIDKSLAYGKNSLLIKAVDFIDNSKYYHLAEDDETRDWFLHKMEYFMEKSEAILKTEPIWDLLESSYTVASNFCQSPASSIGDYTT